jgi:hypothetical protein
MRLHALFKRHNIPVVLMVEVKSPMFCAQSSKDTDDCQWLKLGHCKLFDSRLVSVDSDFVRLPHCVECFK